MKTQDLHIVAPGEPPPLSIWQSAILAYLYQKTDLKFDRLKDLDDWIERNFLHYHYAIVRSLRELMWISPPENARIIFPVHPPEAA